MQPSASDDAYVLLTLTNFVVSKVMARSEIEGPNIKIIMLLLKIGQKLDNLE